MNGQTSNRPRRTGDQSRARDSYRKWEPATGGHDTLSGVPFGAQPRVANDVAQHSHRVCRFKGREADQARV
jgi:hypothetical protein